MPRRQAFLALGLTEGLLSGILTWLIVDALLPISSIAAASIGTTICVLFSFAFFKEWSEIDRS